MKIYDVVALGELLIDFTQNGVSEQGNIIFEANPGGAPCNVLALLRKFDKKTSFIGKVGDDQFGRMLKQTIESIGIDTSNVILDKEVQTTLAFVHKLKDGDRDFSFYRNPGADMMLKEEEVNENLLESTKIFHFGTLSMTHQEVREATKKAIKLAKENDALISFDPNIRELLWESMDEAREQVSYGLSQCDILKISDNELSWYTGKDDYTEGVAELRKKYSIPLILVSMGLQGSRAYYYDKMVEVGAFKQKDTIDTTGAGDTFFGCILNYILDHDFKKLTEIHLKEMLTEANAAASIITMRRGALKMMPTKDEIRNMMNKK